MKRFFKFGNSNRKGSFKNRENERPSVSEPNPAPISRLSSMSSSSSGWGSVTNFDDNHYRIDGFNIKGFTKLHKACWLGNLDKAKKHMRDTGVNQVDIENRNPLHLACAQGHETIIIYLLQREADLDLKDANGNSPLLVSILNRHQAICNILLDKGANLNDRTKNGDSGLHLAAKFGLQDVTVSLVGKRADINAVNNNGSTPLHLATSLRQVEMVKLLLRLGANVNCADRRLLTCLMIACEEGFDELVGIFINHQVDAAVVNADGLTAEDIARLAGNDQCVDMLQKYSCKSSLAALDIETDFGYPNESTSVQTPEFKKADKETDSDSWNDDDSFELPIEKTLLPASNSVKLVDLDSPLKIHDNATNGIITKENTFWKFSDSDQPSIINEINEGVLPAVDNESNSSRHSNQSQSKCKQPENVASEEKAVNRDLMSELGLSDVSDFSNSSKNSDNIQINEEDDTDVEDANYITKQNPLSLNEDGIILENKPKTNFVDFIETVHCSIQPDYVESDEESVSIGEGFGNAKQPQILGFDDKTSIEGTLGRHGTMHEVDEVWETNACASVNDWKTDEENVYYAQLAVVNSKESTIERERCSSENQSQLSDGILEDKFIANEKLEYRDCDNQSQLSDVIQEVKFIANEKLGYKDYENQSQLSDEDKFIVNEKLEYKDYENMWNEICQQLFGKRHDEFDESTNSISGPTVDDDIKENSLKDITFPEVSLNEDSSNISVQEDRLQILISCLIKDPANNDKILNLIQRLRQIWLKEKNLNFSLQHCNKYINAEIAKTRSKYDSAISSHLEAENKLSQMESELESIQHQLSMSETKHQDLELQLKRRQSQLESLEEKYLQEVNMRQEAQVALRASQEELRVTGEVFNEIAERQIAVEVVEKATMTTQPIETCDEKVLKLMDENQILRDKLNSQQQHCAKLEEKIEFLQKQMSIVQLREKELEENTIKLKRELSFATDSDANNKKTEVEIEGWRNKMLLMERNANSAMKELNISNEECDKLRFQLVETENEAKANRERFNKQISQHTNDMTSLLNKLEMMQKNYNNCKTDLEAAEKLNSFLEESQTGVQSKWQTVIESLHQKLESTSRECLEIREKAMNDKSRLMGELNETIIQKSEVEIELARVRREMLRISEMLKATETNLQDKEKSLFNVENKMKSILRDNQFMSEQISKFTETEKDQQINLHQLKCLQNELELLKSQLNFEVKLVKEESEKNRKLNDEVKKLQSEAENWSDIEQNLHFELNNLKSALNVERNETDKIKKKRDTELNEVRDELSSAKMISEELGEKLNLKDHESDLLRKSLELLKRNSKDFVSASADTEESPINTRPKSSNLHNCLRDDEEIQSPETVKRECDKAGSLENLYRLMESFVKELRHNRNVIKTEGHFQTFDNHPTFSPTDSSEYLHRSELEMIKGHFETQYQLELNSKLEQINRFLEEQSRATDHLDELHNRSRAQMQQQYQTAIQNFQIEMSRMQVFIKEKEIREYELEEQYLRLKDQVKVKKRIKRKLYQPKLFPSYVNDRRFKVEDYTMLSSSRTRVNQFRDANFAFPSSFLRCDFPAVHRS